MDITTEFPAVSKDEWLARIAKDLKDKSLQDLYWSLGGDMEVDPFAHRNDFDTPAAPLSGQKLQWEINENIVPGSSASEANQQALEALRFGAESLCFDPGDGNVSEYLETALSGIHPDYISLHFSGAGMQRQPAQLLAALGRHAAASGLNRAQLRGSLHYDPLAGDSALRDWRYTAELIQLAETDFPGFRCITLDGGAFFQGKNGAHRELAALIGAGNTCLEKLQQRGLPPERAARQIQFTVYIGDSYFVEMAKLRALSILWMNVLKAWGAPVQLPQVAVQFSPGVYTDELYTNMIRAVTMSMSAVLGGAQQLTVLPYDAGREGMAQYPRSFARRIARNVQHLLKMESFFDQVADPAAGSYYIEKLTQQLAATAWNRFQQGSV